MTSPRRTARGDARRGLLVVCAMAVVASLPSLTTAQAPVRVDVKRGAAAEVVLLDTADPRATAVIPLSQAPKVLAVSADGRRLYVSHPEPGGVSLIDLVARKLVKAVTLSGAPDEVAVVR